MLTCHQEIKAVVKFSPYLKRPSSAGVYFPRDNVNCRATEPFVSANSSVFSVSQEPVRLSFSLLFWTRSEQRGDVDQGSLSRRGIQTVFWGEVLSPLGSLLAREGLPGLLKFFFYI